MRKYLLEQRLSKLIEEAKSIWDSIDHEDYVPLQETKQKLAFLYEEILSTEQQLKSLEKNGPSRIFIVVICVLSLFVHLIIHLICG